MAALVEKIENSNFPILVSFPQGIPNDCEDLMLTAGIKQTNTSNNNSTRKMMIIGEGMNSITYKSENSSSIPDVSKYAIGVIDQKTGKMTIIQTDQVFTMRPQFKISESNKRPRNSSMNNSERRQSLTEEFGSRKKKRALHAAQSNTISIENISGAATIENILTSKSPNLRNDLIVAAEQALKNKSRKANKSR